MCILIMIIFLFKYNVLVCAQNVAYFNYNTEKPLFDIPFSVSTILPTGTQIFYTKWSDCRPTEGLTEIIKVNAQKNFTLKFIPSSLNREIQDDSNQTLYWCTTGRTSPLSSFDLYAVYYNPRYYFPGRPWTVTFSEALPVGSVVGYTTKIDCSGVQEQTTMNATWVVTWTPQEFSFQYICARIPNSANTLTDFIPVNMAVPWPNNRLNNILQVIRYNNMTQTLSNMYAQYSISSSNTCRDFALPVQPVNERINITVPAGEYYICALQYGYQQYGIYVPFASTFTVRDYSISPRILYANRSTSMTLSTDAQRDKVNMSLFSNTNGQRTQIADWSFTPLWNVSVPGVYEAWSQNSSNTWFSRTVVVRPTPTVTFQPSVIKLGLSAQAFIDRSDVLLPSGYIDVTLQTLSGLIMASNSTLTDSMTLQVAPGKAQNLSYKITVPYNISCPTQQLQDNVNDDNNNINCQSYEYTIGSVSAVPYYLQYTPLIALREVNFTLDDTVTLRTGAAIKFVPYNGLCTDAPLDSSLQFVLNDPSIRSFTLTQFPSSGIWQFCINEVSKEDNGFKSVLELNVHDVASVTPLSFIPGLPATVTITKTPVNTSVYLTNSTTCNDDDNVVVRAISNATGVATLSFTLRDESNVLLVCVQYDGGVERGVSQSSVISVGSITPSPLSFTPTSLINKHETQVDFEVHSGSQLNSGTASAYITSNTQCDNSAGSVLSQSVIHNTDNTPYTKPYARFFINIENIVTDRVNNVCVCYRNMCVPAGNVEIVSEMTLATLPSTATAGLPVSVQLSGNAFIDFSPDTFVLIPMISDYINQDRCAQYSDGLINSYVNGTINSNDQTTQEFTLPVNVLRAVMCVRNSNNAISFMYAGTLSFYSFTSRSRFVQIGLTNDLNTWPDPSSTSSLYLIPYNGPEFVNITDGKNLCSDSKIRKYYTSSNQRLNNDTPTGTYLLCESVQSSSSLSSLLHVVSSNNTIYAVSPWSLTLPSTPIRQYVTFEVQLSGGNGYRPFQQYAMEYAPNLNEEEKWSDIFTNINSKNQQNGNMNNNQFDVEYDEGSTRANYHHYNYTTKQHISPFVNQLADINTPYKLIIIPASTTCYDYDKDNSSYDLFYFTPESSSSSLSISLTMTNVTPITEITFCLLPSDDDRITLQRALLQTYMEPSTIVSQEATLFIPGNNGIASQSQAKLSDNAECNGNVSNIAYLSTLGNYYNLTLDSCNNSQIAEMTEVYFCEGTGGSGSIGVLFRNMGKVNILRRSVCPSGGAPASITNVMTPPASPITSFGINTSLLSKPFLSQSINCAFFADNTTLAQYGYSPELNENAIFYVCAFIIANPTQIFTTLTPTLQVKNWEITPSSVLSRYNATMGALPVVPQLHISHVVPSLSEPFISLSEYCDSSLMSASPFITENATLPFSTTAMNGMAYVCLSSSAPTITSTGTTSTTPFAIAQFLMVTPPTITFIDFALFPQVPFTVSLVVNAYDNSDPLYSMIPNADVNYTYHGYYVVHTRRVFLALRPDCNEVVSDKLNVSDANNSVSLLTINTYAFVQKAAVLCAETPAGVAYLTNVKVVLGNIYPKTVVTGIESTLYIPSKPETTFKWSNINGGCDNFDNLMQTFMTNISGYASVNLTRTDGSSAPVGVYTLCAVSSLSGTSSGFTYVSVDTITVVPLLHYNVKGTTFIVNVSSMVYLLDDLKVDKLEVGFSQQQHSCNALTDQYGNWSKVTGALNRIQIHPNSTTPNPLYLCVSVNDNDTKVTIPLDAARAFNFVPSPFALPRNGFDMCSPQTINSCTMPGSDSNDDGIIGIIAGDCCNAQDSVREKWIGWSNVNTINHTCTFTWNNTLRSSLSANTQFSICAWKSTDPFYCTTLQYTSIAGCGSGDISGGTGALPGWLIAVIVICVVLFIVLLILITLICCKCITLSCIHSSRKNNSNELQQSHGKEHVNPLVRESKVQILSHSELVELAKSEFEAGSMRYPPCYNAKSIRVWQQNILSSTPIPLNDQEEYDKLVHSYDKSASDTTNTQCTEQSASVIIFTNNQEVLPRQSRSLTQLHKK